MPVPVQLPYVRRYHQNSLTVNGPEITAVRRAARDNNVSVVLGFSEKDAGSLYMAQVIIGSDGNTYNMLTLGVGAPEEYLVNIAEMYAPATARFSDVQVVPEGVTAGQVLVTMTNTGERVYFGTPPA